MLRDQEDRSEQLDELKHLIEHAAHLLPAQGPITVFVHHNTLHAFEDLPFDQAVLEGSRIFGCEPYLSEERYREMMIHERIRTEDISAVLIDDLGDEADVLLGFLGTRYHLRLAMLQHPLRTAPAAELRWVVAETDALRRFSPDVPASVRERSIEQTRHWVMRDLRNSGRPVTEDEFLKNEIHDLIQTFGEAHIEEWSAATWESFTLHVLWRMCYHGVHGVHTSFVPTPPPVRVRDVLLETTGIDSDERVNELLIRFCGAFLDQGFAHWRLPNRDQGFYRAFLALYREPGGPPDVWREGLHKVLDELVRNQTGPLECIDESLSLLGVATEEREVFLSAILLSLRGFAGMIWQMETRGDRVAHPAPTGSLIEFLAVRLILERFALTHAAREGLGFRGPLEELRTAARRAVTPEPGHDAVSVEQRAFMVFQLAQSLAWKPQDLYGMKQAEWATLVQEIEAFSNVERRRIYHQAFERLYMNQALDALTLHHRRDDQAAATPRLRRAGATSNGNPNGNGRASKPKFQLITCIDDREESFRRHLEEIQPACETFGAAGFFGVVMYYRGLTDAHFTPLCPIILRPSHYVEEEPVYIFEETHRRRSQTRRVLGAATHRWHIGSRTLLGGVFTSLFGSLASFPLVTRVLFPRLTAKLRKKFGGLVQSPPVTQLRLERGSDVPPGPHKEAMGYTVDEMAGIVERQLRDIGLTSRFARLVVFVGHGSSSLNNPHESAYNCGACAGSRGGPNARAFARMANDSRVRDLLFKRGLTVPHDVVFIGAYHNTCNDSVTFFDLDRLPASHKTDFDATLEVIDEARKRNAHERCRRFETAPLTLSPEAALRHVEGRSEDLAQTRPEYNHATNAVTLVARRSRSRGLFLDRRTFLTSYDPAGDDEHHTILARILRAAIPVCAGISLEYYFSCVDPAGWGCGTKLPHNVASLLGVMAGAASDLRTGLSNQMVEIHEPLRQLFVIETTPEGMLQIMRENEQIDRLVRNEWVFLATLSPHSSDIHVFRNGRFERRRPGSNTLPEVDSSQDWYRGWRGHLGFARVRAAMSSPSEDA
jgi:uncharacterized protein YbcC (UPF0753/DUF2309 family)